MHNIQMFHDHVHDHRSPYQPKQQSIIFFIIEIISSRNKKDAAHVCSCCCRTTIERIDAMVRTLKCMYTNNHSMFICCLDSYFLIIEHFLFPM
jgi:hypothetical protein